MNSCDVSAGNLKNSSIEGGTKVGLFIMQNDRCLDFNSFSVYSNTLQSKEMYNVIVVFSAAFTSTNTCGTQQNCSYQCLQSGKAHQSSTIVINNKEWSCYCRKCTGKILRARKCQRNKWKAAYGNCLELILFVATPPTKVQHYYHICTR